MKIKYVRIGVLALIIFVLVLFGVTYFQGQLSQRKPQAVLVTGFSKDEGKGFRQELITAFKETDILHTGDALLREGNIDGAIVKYEEAFRISKLSGAKALAIISIANAYEKKRDYKKALEYIIIDRDKYVNDWAKEPIVERANYLQYAIEGEYNLAVEYAQKAREADAKLPNAPKGGSPDYIQRLDDLKMAKEYILGLKREK